MERLKNETFQIKLLIVLLFLLLNIALIFFVGIPRISSVDDVAMEHDEKLLRVELMLANERAIDEKETRIELLKAEVEGFEEMVPDHVDYPQVIHDFYTYSLDQEVEPLYLSFSDAALIEETGETEEDENMVEEEKDILSALTLNFTARGSSAKIMKFLEDLDDISPLALTVDNVSLYNSEDGALRADVTFRQYVRGLASSDIPYEEYSFYVDSVGFSDLASLFEVGTGLQRVEEEPDPADNEATEETAAP
ncbi:hypothetical protein ACHAL6_09175 [Proteiniclasticum sp. C24MP]|uniref:hypothetical protein n=1 Tax=Proteiniclasticum sp. C24MP TaxID=3374101 RepID=UPI0037548E09